MRAFQTAATIGHFPGAIIAQATLISLRDGANVCPIRLPDISDEIVHRSGLVEWQRRKVVLPQARVLN